jgi:heme ABC exporter ATP-binding subunit CcmA
MDQARPAQAVIRLDGVARRFGQRWVLRGIDLTVEPGEVVAMTGRNGSGKTTLLRIIATLLRPTRGTATVLGHDTVRAGAEIRGRVGLLGHNSGLYDDLTAAENLVFSMRMAGVAADREAIAQALTHVGLAEVADERARGFSAGMRRRLGLARLLLRPPTVLLLDEPYASFDEDGIDVVNTFATEVARGGGVVLLTTHDLTRATDVMSRRVHVADGLLSDVDRAAAGGAAHPVQSPRIGVMP